MNRLSDGGSIPPRSTSDHNIPNGKQEYIRFPIGNIFFSENGEEQRQKQRKFVHKRDINLWYSRKNDNKEALADGVFKDIGSR